MLGYIRGSLYFIYGLVVSFSSNKSIEENSNNKNEQTQSCNNIQINNIDKNPNFLGVIPYKAEEITHSMLRNPDDPHYIGHFFPLQERGAQYNL